MPSWRRPLYPLCSTRPGHWLARLAVSGLRRFGWRRKFSLPLEALQLDHAAFAGLTRLWSRIHWAGEDGMMPPDQLLAIYKLAVHWPVEGAIVEIGAWKGLTTSYLATACRVRRRGRVYAVDTFAGTKEGGEVYGAAAALGGSTLPVFRKRIRRTGLDRFVMPLVGWSHAAARQYTGEPIRLLFIDADHSYEGVMRDYDCWQPLVARGGLVVFHDYAMPGVRQFVHDHVLGAPDVDAKPREVVPNVLAVTKVSPAQRRCGMVRRKANCASK